MATTDAINAVCNAIVYIMRTSMAGQSVAMGFDELDPEFATYTSKDFTDAPAQTKVTIGATVFLYRVLPNINHRTPPGRVLPNGQRQRAKLPVDLHLMVTIWGDTATTQNRLIGWVLRTLEDYPTIPASILNLNLSEPIFRDDEATEFTIGEMSGDELLQLWDQLGDGELYYHLSIPYIARAVSIESQRTQDEHDPVQVRTLNMQHYDEGSS